MMTSDPSVENSLPPISERGLTDDEITILLDKIAAIHRSAEMLTKAFRTDDAPSSELPIPSVSSAVFHRRLVQHRQDIHDRHDHLSPIMKQLDAFANHLIQELIEGTTEGYLAVCDSEEEFERRVFPLCRHYPQFVGVIPVRVGTYQEKTVARIPVPGDQNRMISVNFGTRTFISGSSKGSRICIAFFRQKEEAEKWLDDYVSRAQPIAEEV